MSEPDTLILVLLRELRADTAAMEHRMDARFEQLDAQFAEMRTRLDKRHADGPKALQGSISHRNRASFVPSVFPTASFSAESSEGRGPRRRRRGEEGR